MTAPNDEPQRIGRYELTIELGQGPLGRLYAAVVIDGSEEGRLVALRRVRFGAGNRAIRHAAAKSAGLGLSLRHPKVAALLDVIERDDELLLASEYVEGESLGAMMRQAIHGKTPIPPSSAAAIVRDAVDAAIAVRDHFSKTAKGVTPFGGLVPDCLTVASFGETMMTEPGVLAALDDAAFRPPALGYRAPEQRERVAATERAEVYALGVMLWEMLANRPLFRSRAAVEAAARAEVAAQIRAGAIPRLDSLPRQSAPLHPRLVDLVDGAVRMYPELRLQTLDALKSSFAELPRDAIASPDQVVVTLERLAHDVLETRRSALSRIAEGGRISLSPESKRSTARPPGPEAGIAPDNTVRVAAALGFAEREAPTARRKPTPPGIRPLADQPATQTPIMPAVPRPEPERAPVTTESSSVSVLEGAEIAAVSERRSSMRRFLPAFVVGGVLIVAVSILLVAASKRTRNDQAVVPAIPASGTAVPAASSAELTGVEELEPPATTPSSVVPAASGTSGKRRTPREQEPPRPKNPQNFRPKGI